MARSQEFSIQTASCDESRGQKRPVRSRTMFIDGGCPAAKMRKDGYPLEHLFPWTGSSGPCKRMITGKAFDNRAGCAILWKLCGSLRTRNIKATRLLGIRAGRSGPQRCPDICLLHGHGTYPWRGHDHIGVPFGQR
jgi:hypothetical protein